MTVRIGLLGNGFVAGIAAGLGVRSVEFIPKLEVVEVFRSAVELSVVWGKPNPAGDCAGDGHCGAPAHSAFQIACAPILDLIGLIAFKIDRDGHFTIDLVKADRANPARLTNHPTLAVASRGCWEGSPPNIPLFRQAWRLCP